MPRIDKIFPVAQFFNVRLEYFLTGTKINLDTSDDEKRLLAAYRDQSEEGKKMVRKLLDLEEPTNRVIDDHSDPDAKLRTDLTDAFTKITT